MEECQEEVAKNQVDFWSESRTLTLKAGPFYLHIYNKT